MQYMALHRRQLILAGLASTTAIAGCFENNKEPEEPMPEPETEPERRRTPDGVLQGFGRPHLLWMAST